MISVARNALKEKVAIVTLDLMFLIHFLVISDSHLAMEEMEVKEKLPKELI